MVDGVTRNQFQIDTKNSGIGRLMAKLDGTESNGASASRQSDSGDRLILSAEALGAAEGLRAVNSTDSYNIGSNAKGSDGAKKTADEAASGDPSMFAVTRLKERLKELKEEIKEKQEELQKMEGQPASEARDKKIELLRTQLTAMMAEMQELNKKIKDQEGGGVGDALKATGGGGMSSSSHIGSSKDPFAAAQQHAAANNS